MKKTILWICLNVFISAFLCACGASKGGVDNSAAGEVNPPDNTATYTVTAPGTWSMTADGSGSDTLVFSRTGNELSWSDYQYNDGNAGIDYLVWARVLLKFPVIEGDSWTESGGSNEYTIDSATVVEDIDAEVTVKAGTFTSCVVTKETFSVDPAYNSGAFISVYKKYFAPGVGLVKVVDTWYPGKVTTGELVEYHVQEADPDDYFPMEMGDWWKFDWTTE
jgi:hypothetical protein